MFRGVNNINLDSKGRMALPTRYREPLRACASGDVASNGSDGAQIVLTITWGERCLSLYPLPEWEIIERKVISLPSLDPTAQRLKRLLVGHAAEIELDKSGRMLVPGELREYAYLDKHVVLVGQGNKFELWDQTLWDKKREDWLPSSESDAAQASLSIELEQLSL
ncbi:MAG: division/cell wall cluster transcriptional repressor MraZ [Arenicellales bacterium WSBS_2016_MAG_OTU3]